MQIGFVQGFLFYTSDATVPLGDSAGRPGKLVLDHKSRRVWINQILLVPPLSAQQFRLLELLYENPGQVIGRVDLVTAVWGEDQAAGVSDQALDALLRRLRERLSALDPEQPFKPGEGAFLLNPNRRPFTLTFVGEVPEYAVVVPGTLPAKPLKNGQPGPATACAVIVKRVDERTRAKTSINELLRD